MNILNDQVKKHLKRALFSIIVAGITWVTLLCWALPMPATCIIGFLVTLLFFSAGPLKGLLSTIVFIMFTCAANLAVRLPPIVSRLYVSPFEILNHYDKTEGFVRFEPNANIQMERPFGDLCSFSPGNPNIPKVSRNVKWETDSLGFRNSRDFQPGDWILIGASNIMGGGMDQEQTITNQLNRLGFPSYNLAGPGFLVNYANYLNYARDKLDCSQSRAVLFFSEWDFANFNSPAGVTSQSLESIPIPKTQSIINKCLMPVKKRFGLTKLRLYRTCFLLRTGTTRRQLENAPISNESNAVTTGVVHGIPIAFLNVQALPACRPEMHPQSPVRERAFKRWADALNSMKPHLQLVVFIPDKYRIYQPFLEPARSPSLPLPLTRANQSFLQEVCDSHNLPLLDLTPLFAQAAEEALKRNQLLYWPDDTHWNNNGVSVAASHVAAFMKSSAGVPPPSTSK